jgi:SAM-dependent methyltransferase
MNEFIEANRRNWDDRVPIHLASDFYDVAAFKSGKSDLLPVELEEVGDVRGKTLLHLQCHVGLSTLSWARQGAIVTGVDFSRPAIAAARALADELSTSARFIESDVYSLPSALTERFDVVFTSLGVLCWLPDLSKWAQVVAQFLRPGETFYILEGHPLVFTLDDAPNVTELRHAYPYFETGGPIQFESEHTYTGDSARLAHPTTYEWPHSMGEIVTSLCEVGLQIEFLHEFPYLRWQALPFLERDEQGNYRLTRQEGQIPLLFSIRARKPASAGMA